MNKTIVKECKHHGNTEFVLRADNHYRCRKCAVDAVSRARRNKKVKAIKYKGGSCIICNYSTCNRALEFHHLDPTQKDFGIASKGNTISWALTKIELDKCILVCSNCHAEIHSGLHKEYGA